MICLNTNLSLILRSCLFRKGAWPEGGVNSIHKAIRGVEVAAGRSVSSANNHLVSDWVASAAHLNTPLAYTVKQTSLPELRPVSVILKSQVTSMRCKFHIADAALHFHRKHHTRNLYSVILTGLEHPYLKYTHFIYYTIVAAYYLLNLHIKYHFQISVSFWAWDFQISASFCISKWSRSDSLIT